MSNTILETREEDEDVKGRCVTKVLHIHYTISSCWAHRKMTFLRLSHGYMWQWE